MATTLNNFIANIKQGVSRTNRYTVQFNLPLSVNVSQDSLRKVLLFCDQIQLPGMNFSTIQNRTFGEFRETPYEKLFDNVNMNFYVDKDFLVKAMFDGWMASIQDPETRTFNYYNNYTTDITIDVQDTVDLTRYRLRMYECYPKTMGSIQLDYASKEVMKLSVSMQYKYWKATQTYQTSENSDVKETSDNLIASSPPIDTTPQGISGAVIPTVIPSRNKLKNGIGSVFGGNGRSGNGIGSLLSNRF